jgi:hypothetical protein
MSTHVPLLQAINAQHDGERKRPPPALRAQLRFVRRYHRFELAPRHHSRHLGQDISRFLGQDISRFVRFFFAAKPSDAKLS